MWCPYQAAGPWSSSALRFPQCVHRVDLRGAHREETAHGRARRAREWGHSSSPTGCMMRAIASTIRAHRVDSCVSCFRPLGVSS